MRKHRCPGGVKLARFPGMCLGFDSRVKTLFSIDRVFTLCLPCYSSSLSACTVQRGSPSTASCLTHS